MAKKTSDAPMPAKKSMSEALEAAKMEEASLQARRKFMKNAGKFALATPPAVTALLASAKGNYAVAVSGGGHGGRHGGGGHGNRGRHGNNGFGNGGGDGVPGRSGKSDRHR